MKRGGNGVKKKNPKTTNEKKLTEEQEQEMMVLYYDEGVKQVEIAKMYGVSQTVVSRTLNKPEALAWMLKQTSSKRLRAQILINTQLEAAVGKQVELMNRELPEGLLYLQQNAARDLLDRGGVRVKDEEKQEITVNFAGSPGFDVGMPDHSGDDDF